MKKNRSQMSFAVAWMGPPAPRNSPEGNFAAVYDLRMRLALLGKDHAETSIMSL